MPIIQHLPELHLPDMRWPPKAGARAARFVATVGLAGLLGVLGLGLSHWERREAQLLRYRSTLATLTTALRTMRARAMARHRAVRLEIDASLGVFRVLSIPDAPQVYTTLEQTIWLPAGLEVLEAPGAGLTVSPMGRCEPAALLFAAPAYHRAFRLRLDPQGSVHLREEWTL